MSTGHPALPAGGFHGLESAPRATGCRAKVRRLVSEGRAPRDPNFSGQSGNRITRSSGEFTTADTSTFTRELEQLHPENSDKQHRGRSPLLL